MRYTLIGIFLGLLVLGLVPSGCEAQMLIPEDVIDKKFGNKDEARQFALDTLWKHAVCGSAVSAVNDAFDQFGPANDLIISPTGFQLIWLSDAGRLSMVMYNQTSDEDYETCMSWYVID